MALFGLVALAVLVLYLLDRILVWCKLRGWIRYRLSPRVLAGRRSIGAGAAGTIYDMLNEDKRRAIDIIVEERAGARDPEDRDGNLPDLENPRRAAPDRTPSAPAPPQEG
jgi:hypothetical protein